MYQHLVRRLSLGIILAALLAIAVAVSGTAAQIGTMLAALSRLQPAVLGTALALSALSALLSGVLWWRLLQRLGHPVPFLAALSAYLYAGLAGYVVNIAGPVMGSALSLRRHGVTPGRAALLTLIANALGFCGILACAPVGMEVFSHAGMATALPLLGQYGPAAIDAGLAALVVVMLLVLRVLASAAGAEHRIVWSFLKCAHAPEGDASPVLRTRQLLALVPCSAASWVVGALALYVVLGAMGPAAKLTVGAVIGAAVVAAALGSLAFFAPEGVGVKDGVLVALLAHTTGLPLTTCVAAAVAVRALDPVTKLGLLGVLVLTANAMPARLLTGSSTWLAHMTATALQWSSRTAMRRRRVALGLACALALVSVVSGYGAVARADQDRAPTRASTSPAHVQTVSLTRHTQPR